MKVTTIIIQIVMAEYQLDFVGDYDLLKCSDACKMPFPGPCQCTRTCNFCNLSVVFFPRVYLNMLVHCATSLLQSNCGMGVVALVSHLELLADTKLGFLSPAWD